MPPIPSPGSPRPDPTPGGGTPPTPTGPRRACHVAGVRTRAPPRSLVGVGTHLSTCCARARGSEGGPGLGMRHHQSQPPRPRPDLSRFTPSASARRGRYLRTCAQARRNAVAPSRGETLAIMATAAKRRHAEPCCALPCRSPRPAVRRAVTCRVLPSRLSKPPTRRHECRQGVAHKEQPAFPPQPPPTACPPIRLLMPSAQRSTLSASASLPPAVPLLVRERSPSKNALARFGKPAVPFRQCLRPANQPSAACG